MNNMNSFKNNSIVELIKSSINLNYLEIKNCTNILEEVFLHIYQVYKNSSHSLSIQFFNLEWLEVISDHGIDLFINKLAYLTS